MSSFIICSPQKSYSADQIKVAEARRVVCMREKRNAYTVWVGKPKGTRPFEDLGVHQRLIFKEILKNMMKGHELG